MKKIIVRHRSSHHASNSGYSRLIDYFPDSTIISGNIKFPYRVAKFISQRTNQKFGMYDSLSFLKELELFKTLSGGKEKSIVHYLNAERDIRNVVKNNKYFKNVSFCGTFHKPPLVLEKQIKNNKYLKKLNGAIVVGSNQVDFLKNWLEIDKVEYIPHGVDTNFFFPDESKRKGNKLLFVGQHLRDFEMLNTCVPLIAEKVKNLEVKVVLRRDFYDKVKPHAAIKLFSGIDDAALRKMYQEASLLFLPLTQVTACNSILEAMACGLPIITTDVGGNSSYLKGTNNVLAPLNDIDFITNATIDLLKNQDLLKNIGISSRTNSLKYDWGVISEQINLFYKSLVLE